MLLICGEVLSSIGRPRIGASEMLVSNRIAYSFQEVIELPLLICVRRSSVNVSKTYGGVSQTPHISRFETAQLTDCGSSSVPSRRSAYKLYGEAQECTS